MVTWEQIVALPEYQQATPEKQAKVRELYLGMVSEKVGRAKDVMGGKAVTEASNASQQQATQEQAVARSARSKMESMRQRGVKVPEEEALRTPVYDPVDLVVDAATGFMGSAGKAALKAGTKALAKNVAREVGTGAVAGAGMALADKAGAGEIGKLAAGLGGGVVGGAALTGARRLVASLVRRGIPESHASRIVSEMDPEAVERAIRAIGGFEYEEPVKDLPAFYPDRTDESLRKAAENVARWSAPLEEAGTDFRRADVPPEKVVREPVFGVEDNPKGRTLTVEEPGQVTVDELLEGQRLDFAPEEAVPNRGSIEYDEHAGTMTIPLPSGVKHLPEGVTRGEDGKLYITIASTPRGKVRVAPEVAQAVPEVAPKVKAPVEAVEANIIKRGEFIRDVFYRDSINDTPTVAEIEKALRYNDVDIENYQKLYQDYLGKKYKPNKRTVGVGHTDDFDSSRATIGYINESRKRKTLALTEQYFDEAQKLKAKLNAMLEKAKRVEADNASATLNGEAEHLSDPEKWFDSFMGVDSAGIAPSVPKAEKFSPGSELGIVSDAYLGKVPQPIRRFFGGLLEYRYGQPEEYKQIAEGALNTTGHVATEARKMVDSAKALARKTKTSDADVLGYLRGYNKNVTPELAAELDNIRTAIDKWGDEAVSVGLLSPDKRKTDYLARIYERHLVDAYEPTLEARQGAIDYLISTKNATNEEEAEIIIQNILEGNGMKLVNGPSIPAKLDMGRFMERQDIPYPIRKLLGEVTNPYHLAWRSINDVARDVTQVKMFKQIAENPLWASKTAKPGFVKINTATLPKGLSHALDVMKDKWGDVGGLYIKKEIADDLKKTYSVANEYAQMYGVLQGTWKMMKVPMNPATVTTNIISNSILCHLGGLPLWRQAVALPDAMLNVIRSRKGNMDPIYKALEDNHMFTGNYTENELGILYEGLSLAMNRTKNNALRVAYALQWAVKKAGGQKAADFYGAVEDTYKYMLAKDLMRRGRGPTVQDMVKGRFGRTKLTPAEAVKETELWLFNYRHLPEPLKALRRTVVPFISWPYFSGKAMGRAVLNYPHRVLPILALGYAIDDKMKDEGKDIKLSKYLPYFDTMSEDWQTLGGIPVPPNLQPGGVAVSLFEGWLGRSLHGGRDIFSSDDPDEVKAQKQREYFWNTYTPPILGYSGKRVLDAVTGQPKNRYGDVEEVGTALAGSLAGVQIRPDDRVTHYREIKRLMGKIEQEKNYLKWYLKQGYSEADKLERLDLARQRIAEFTKQLDEAVKAYQSARK